MLQYNLRVSKGSDVNFVLSILLLSLCANSDLLPLYMTAVCCRHCSDTPLQSASDNPVKTPFPLFWSCIRYAGRDGSLLAAPLWDTDKEPSKPLLPFWQVGHRRIVLAQCAPSCTIAPLMPPSSSSHISSTFIIRYRPHNIKSTPLFASAYATTTDIVRPP